MRNGLRICQCEMWEYSTSCADCSSERFSSPAVCTAISGTVIELLALRTIVGTNWRRPQPAEPSRHCRHCCKKRCARPRKSLSNDWGRSKRLLGLHSRGTPQCSYCRGDNSLVLHARLHRRGLVHPAVLLARGFHEDLPGHSGQRRPGVLSDPKVPDLPRRLCYNPTGLQAGQPSRRPTALSSIKTAHYTLVHSQITAHLKFFFIITAECNGRSSLSAAIT